MEEPPELFESRCIHRAPGAERETLYRLVREAALWRARLDGAPEDVAAERALRHEERVRVLERVLAVVEATPSTQAPARASLEGGGRA